MSLKHCEKTRECWKHIGKQTPGFSLLWLLWTRPKALGWEQPGFHWARIMERSALPLFYSSSYFFWELNVTVLPTQADQKPGVLQPSATAQTPSPAVRETWVGPHISRPSGNHWSHPRHHTAGGYSCSSRLWMFMISEYLTAIHRELLRDLSSQQMAIHPTLAGPLSCVR